MDIIENTNEDEWWDQIAAPALEKQNLAYFTDKEKFEGDNQRPEIRSQELLDSISRVFEINGNACWTIFGFYNAVGNKLQICFRGRSYLYPSYANFRIAFERESDLILYKMLST